MTPASRRVRRAQIVARWVAARVMQTGGFPGWWASRLWLLLGLALVWGFWYSPSTTGDGPGLRRFRTPEISGTTRIAQQFVMRERMLTGIDVRPSVVGEVGGSLQFMVTDQTDERLIQLVNIPARDVVKQTWFPLTIGRIDDSSGHWFELAVASAPEDPARGVAFWATRGDRLDNAMLFINGAERWADLAFRTHTTTMSMRDGLTQRANVLPRMIIALALIAVWALVGVLLRTVAGMTPRAIPAEPRS